MARFGFNKWASDGDAAGGAVPKVGPGTSVRPAEVVQPDDSSGVAHAEDLEIEKKRLQLVGLNPDKFDYFFDKYFDRIFNYAFWKTGDHDTAADVSNETFLIAWERRGQFRWQGYSFGAWLFQIARSVVSHQQRKLQTRGETEYIPERHAELDETTPADVLEHKHDQELVRLCLKRLAPDPYEVIILHHFVGMTHRQITLVTKMPLGTVNSHLRRGKNALRQCLEEHGADNGLSEATQRIVRQAAIEDSELSMVDTPDGD